MSRGPVGHNVVEITRGQKTGFVEIYFVLKHEAYESHCRSNMPAGIQKRIAERSDSEILLSCIVSLFVPIRSPMQHRGGSQYSPRERCQRTVRAILLTPALCWQARSTSTCLSCHRPYYAMRTDVFCVDIDLAVSNLVVTTSSILHSKRSRDSSISS